MRGIVAAVVCVLMLAGAGVAQGQGPNPPGLNNVSGVVPALNQAHSGASGVSGFGRLYYHSGGSVMPVNQTYAIYWVPDGYSMSANYKPLIDRYLGDVAADSGKTSNVYYSDTQYYQSAGGVRRRQPPERRRGRSDDQRHQPRAQRGHHRSARERVVRPHRLRERRQVRVELRLAARGAGRRTVQPADQRAPVRAPAGVLERACQLRSHRNVTE